MYCVLVIFALIYCGSASANNDGFNYRFNTSLYQPERAANCSNRSEEFRNASEVRTCHAISSWRRNHSQEYCADFWFYNERVLLPEFKNASERASVQYCNGTSDFVSCVKCFNTATEPFWNMHYCRHYNRTKPVGECLRNYTNAAFNWSRGVILDNKNVAKLINLEYPPYNKCSEYFTNKLFISKNFTVNFPVLTPRYRVEDEEDINVMLSFYLNAFEDNNPSGTTINQTKHSHGFRCQDFQRLGYLDQYYKAWNHFDKDISDRVKTNYEKMRSDMCKNETKCISCFNESDSEFFRRLTEDNFRINSLIAEFNLTSAKYHDCTQRYNLSQEYIAILNNSHIGMEKVNVSNCTDDVKNMYNFLVNNTNYLNTNNETKYKPFIDVTAFNIYSAFGYAAKQNLTETCKVIEMSLMPCVMAFTQYLIEDTRGNVSRREDEEALGLFTNSINSCDIYDYEDYSDYYDE